MGANKIDAVVFPVMAQLPAINGDRNTQLVAEPKPGADAGPSIFYIRIEMIFVQLSFRNTMLSQACLLSDNFDPDSYLQA